MTSELERLDNRLAMKEKYSRKAQNWLAELSQLLDPLIEAAGESEINVSTTPGLSEVRISVELFFEDEPTAEQFVQIREALHDRAWRKSSYNSFHDRNRLYLKDEFDTRA